jgi:hypothetical protein
MMALPVRVSVNGRRLEVHQPSDDRIMLSNHLALTVADDILWVADSLVFECADVVTGQVGRTATSTDRSYTVPVQLPGNRLLIERTAEGRTRPADRCPSRRLRLTALRLGVAAAYSLNALSVAPTERTWPRCHAHSFR